MSNRVGSRPEKQPRWRGADDQALVRHYHAGDTVARICAALGRTPASVENRVLLLRRQRKLPSEAWQVLRRRGDLPERAQRVRRPADADQDLDQDDDEPPEPADVFGPERPAVLWLRAMRAVAARNAAVQETHA